MWLGLSSTAGFPRPITSCSPVLKPILLEDVCTKQEHLIAMTKIKHFYQTQAVFKKSKYFSEPAIFIEVWNLALHSRLARARWVWDQSKSHWILPQKHPDSRGVRQREQGQPQQSPPAGQVQKARHIISQLRCGEHASGVWHMEHKRLGGYTIVDRAGRSPLSACAHPSSGLANAESILGTIPGADNCLPVAWQLWLQCQGVLTLNL